MIAVTIIAFVIVGVSVQMVLGPMTLDSRIQGLDVGDTCNFPPQHTRVHSETTHIHTHKCVCAHGHPFRNMHTHLQKCPPIHNHAHKRAHSYTQKLNMCANCHLCIPAKHTGTHLHTNTHTLPLQQSRVWRLGTEHLLTRKGQGVCVRV